MRNSFPYTHDATHEADCGIARSHDSGVSELACFDCQISNSSFDSFEREHRLFQTTLFKFKHIRDNPVGRAIGKILQRGIPSLFDQRGWWAVGFFLFLQCRLARRSELI